MENKLEQLLNTLVKKGWKPRWLLNEIEYIHAFDDVNQWRRVEISYGDHWYYKALRQIVSKESGLWQFCCENGMQKERPPYNRDSDTYWFTIQEYQYRLIESALKDESELESFLLENIKVD